ncbi:aldo/keto reductase [Blautia producta]|uniref:aldo/keto reductase n=1 Tax=Blautia producta TaxID=33035 RepID=UPI0031B5F8FE
MKVRRFGKTEFRVSPITFGAWSIGGAAKMAGKQIGWSGADDESSVKALETAYDMGINMYDTADSYARGHSEILIGKALSHVRSNIYISTKVGMVDTDTSFFKLDFSRKHIIESCEESLKRLKTDYIDFYLLHMTVTGYELETEIRETMEILKRQGKIRTYGVSVPDCTVGKEQIDKSFGEAMMMEYNILSDAETERVMGEAAGAGIGVITRGSLTKGLLTGKYKRGTRFPENDVRSRLSAEYIDTLLGKVEKLKEYAQNCNCSMLELAVQYQLRLEACSTVSVGLKNPGQVKEIVNAVNNKSDYDWISIKQIMEGTED